ncbi:hypothetical protein V6Z11_A05G081400 [Gossypium hirsutum]
MCVSLYSALINADKTDRTGLRPGFSKLTVSEAEKSIAGNLCRCTGYRPLVDACKSFAADVDMEDLGFNSFWKKGESEDIKLSRLPPYNCNNATRVFPEFLKTVIKAGFNLESEGCCWYSPGSLVQLQSLLQTDEVNDGTSMKIVVGNTGMGYYKELGHHDKYIDLRYIPELSIISKDQTGIKIGASVTISKAIEALKDENDSGINHEGKLVFEKLADHMERVATGFVRNSASMGGNLIMAQRKHFPSDISTILLSVDTMVDILTGHRHETITLEEFLGRPPLVSNSVLLGIKIPCWKSRRDISSKTYTKLLYETYRAAPRPIGNALPYLNAAFLAEISLCKKSAGIVLNNCRLAFGAYGTKHSIRARNVEEFLSAKLLNFGVIYEAIKLLESTIIPEEGTSSPAYRTSLAVGFLFEFLSPLMNSYTDISKLWFDEYNSDLLSNDSKIKQNCDQFNQIKSPALLSSAKQVIQLNKDYHPVGEPLTKVGAVIQASGEAVYVDDIPSPRNCLHGAFIYSTEPLARVQGIKFKPGSSPHGVSTVISFKDIPGENIGAQTIFGSESLYADELTQCAGQRIALVVADTQKNADMAANLAVVDYDKKNLEPILSVEEAFEKCSFYEVPHLLNPEPVGAFSKGMAESDHQILSAELKLGSQYYFYMETQAALAVPDEDNCIVVYSSCQCPEFVHDTIAKCLGVPSHNVRVITRRVGGGFGGKAIKAIPVATACALAAYKLNCPVRMYVNRKTDMIMAGGRHPMKITYSVGFKSNGKITALKLDILVDAGMSADISPVMPHNIIGSLKKSTTSESSCEAVGLCCNILVERLTAQKEKLEEQMGPVKWETLILQAYMISVNLSANSLYVPDFSSMQYLNYGAAVSEVEINLLTGQTTILQTDIIYDCGQSLNPAVDLGQIEGAFVQGIGFFMLEEYPTNSKGLVVAEGTWSYKIPTVDTVPKKFNVEILNSGHHKDRVLSSKASGEPPLKLAASVHCAIRAAIKEARHQLHS